MEVQNIRFTARIPVEIAEWLKEQSLTNTRSMNGEMVECLKEIKRIKTENPQVLEHSWV